ncbi:hypothetical protein M501DRAFT_998617 [Patellaria atrata CBS 101060]|uniref:Uncharacterized protein n=1 Tax=Patellaria atrata CBS 101060 TaxID=1346257 RepID=A0A9P4VUB5_9PEZI|nr:hypothetical protein M501DRAFT_998617 [Patellaria atrata CBS 101060]
MPDVPPHPTVDSSQDRETGRDRKLAPGTHGTTVNHPPPSVSRDTDYPSTPGGYLLNPDHSSQSQSHSVTKRGQVK